MTPLPIRDRFRRLRRTEALRLGLRVDVEASEHTVEGLVNELTQSPRARERRDE